MPNAISYWSPATEGIGAGPAVPFFARKGQLPFDAEKPGNAGVSQERPVPLSNVMRPTHGRRTCQPGQPRGVSTTVKHDSALVLALAGANMASIPQSSKLAGGDPCLFGGQGQTRPLESSSVKLSDEHRVAWDKAANRGNLAADPNIAKLPNRSCSWHTPGQYWHVAQTGRIQAGQSPAERAAGDDNLAASLESSPKKSPRVPTPRGRGARNLEERLYGRAAIATAMEGQAPDREVVLPKGCLNMVRSRW